MKHNIFQAFFKATRSLDFSDGLRTSVELCGLGKMAPNLVLMGFKANWAEDHR